MGLFFGEFTEFNNENRFYEFQENEDESYMQGINVLTVIELKTDLIAFLVDKRYNILIVDRAIRRLLKEI